MSKIAVPKIIFASIAAAAVWAAPASAQYRFDRRIDPQVCSWTEICDYGGRAYLPRRVHYTHVVRHHWHHAAHCRCAPITPDW
jgi:hypothetical protein